MSDVDRPAATTQVNVAYQARAGSSKLRFDSAFGKRGIYLVASFAVSYVSVGLASIVVWDLFAPLEITLVALVVAFAIVGGANWIRLRYGRYLVVDGMLVVRRHWQCRLIPLASITEVVRAESVSLSGWEDNFALGTDLLEIRYRGSTPLPPPSAMRLPSVKAYVSPRDEAAFLAAIGQRIRQDA